MGEAGLEVAQGSPIVADDARFATYEVLAGLDASFFRIRFDRLTPAEKASVKAMAELGAGPHRSGASPGASVAK